MPAYNAEAWIGEAIASVRAQTLSDWELLIVDDVSSDATVAVAQAAAGGDTRVRILRQSANAGPSAARNRGIAEANGRWIALLDADDAYSPERLAHLVALGDERGADLVADNLLLVPERAPADARAMIPAALLREPRPLPLAEFHARNVADPAWPGVNFGFLKPLIRRALLEDHGIRYDERIRFAEDFALYLQCLQAGASWWITPEPLYRYRVREGSLTQVQTVPDLDVLRGRLRQALAWGRAAGRDDLLPLINRHLRVVDRDRHYRRFTDLVKARAFGAAAAEFTQSPRTAALIVQGCLRQAPVLARKVLAGGFRSRPVHAAVQKI